MANLGLINNVSMKTFIILPLLIVTMSVGEFKSVFNTNMPLSP